MPTILPTGQGDEHAPERGRQLAERDGGDGDERRGEREQRQHDAVDPRLERVPGAQGRLLRHREAERRRRRSSRAHPTAYTNTHVSDREHDERDRDRHARAAVELPAQHAEER